MGNLLTQSVLEICLMQDLVTTRFSVSGARIKSNCVSGFSYPMASLKSRLTALAAALKCKHLKWSWQESLL